MSLIKKNDFFFDHLNRLHNEMGNLFRDMTGFSPRIEIEETDKEYIVTAELAGVKKDDVQIELKDKILTIQGEKKIKTKNENSSVFFSERNYGTFRRWFELPKQIEESNIKAKYEDGVLNILIPKVDTTTNHYKIDIE